MSEDYDYPEEPIIPDCNIIGCRNYTGIGPRWKMLLVEGAGEVDGENTKLANNPDECCCRNRNICIPTSLNASTFSQYTPYDPDETIINCQVGCSRVEFYMAGTLAYNWTPLGACDPNLGPDANGGNVGPANPEVCYGYTPYPEDKFPFEELEGVEFSCEENCWDPVENRYVAGLSCYLPCNYSWNMRVNSVPYLGTFQLSTPCQNLTFDGVAMYEAFRDATIIVVREYKMKNCQELLCYTDDTGTYPFSYSLWRYCDAIRTRVRIFAIVGCTSDTSPGAGAEELDVSDITEQFLISSEPIEYAIENCIIHADNEDTNFGHSWGYYWWWNRFSPVEPEPLETCLDVDLPDFWSALDKMCLVCKSSPFCGYYFYYGI